MGAATVVMGTRDRPEQCRQALESVMRVLPTGWSVVVVDQSDGDATAVTVTDLARDAGPIQLVRSARRGLSAARNDGLRAADGDLVLFTDDDCIARPGWAEAWQEAFAENPRMGIGFGRVSSLPYDHATGHTPTFEPGPSSHMHDLAIFRKGIVAIGMGANMAVRRSLLDQAGGFDERLGAGCRYAGAEETDMAYRLARRGALIGHIAGGEIIHHGFRARAAASALSQGYGMGTGAMYAKHIRCGDVHAAEFAAREMLTLGSKVIRHGLTGRRPMGVRALRSLVVGMTSSRRLPIDRDHRVYAA